MSNILDKKQKSLVPVLAFIRDYKIMFEDSLIAACRDGNISAVVSLLQTSTADPNLLHDGGGLLHHAVHSG